MSSLLHEAEALYRARDYTAAADRLEGLTSADALRLRGLCRLRLGSTDAALALLGQARALAPDDPWCRLHHGIALQEAGRYAEAAASFRACQALLPFDPAPWLNLSASLLAQGDVRGAIRAARRGRGRGNLPEADYALGLACLEAGELVRAVSCFRQVVRVAPGCADGWVNLGVAQYRAGEIGAARQAMQRALDTDPGNVAAAANLGSFMRLTGEDEAGEALLRDVLARRPDAAACRVNLAAALLQEDRAGEALALLDGAEPHGTALRQHWQLQKALALIKLSRLEAARTELERLGPVLPALAPLLHWRRALLAAACGDAGASRHQAGLMAAALDVAPAMLPEHRIMAHYDLAKLRAQFGEHDLAFAHGRAGHTLLREAQPFSRTRFAAFVDATMASFDAARMAGGRATGMRRRCSSSACRVPALRCSSRY